MGAYPTSPRNDFLQWCIDHVDIFQSQTERVGLTAAQATAFKAAVDAADVASNEQSAAREAAKTATTSATQKFTALRRSAAEMVRSIKTYAENTNDPNVYVLSQVPPPAAPGTTPPPGTPFDVSAALDTNTGAPVLRWKVRNPANTSGTSYIVRRKLPGESAFTFVGVTGTKSFTDNTFVAGPDSVQYTIQGQRSDRAGQQSPAFTINFGTQPGEQGQTTFKINSTSSGKIAA